MNNSKPKKTLEELTEEKNEKQSKEINEQIEKLNNELSDSKSLMKKSVIPLVYGGGLIGSILLWSSELIDYICVYFLVTGALALLVGAGHLYSGVKTYKECKSLLEGYQKKE